MKRLYFKKWVQNIISTICLLSFFLLAIIDYDKSNLLSIIVVGGIFASTGYLLIKYGRFEDKEDED